MRHTVLVVDDEASIADGLRLTLEAEGYSVRIAGSRAHRARRGRAGRRPRGHRRPDAARRRRARAHARAEDAATPPSRSSSSPPTARCARRWRPPRAPAPSTSSRSRSSPTRCSGSCKQRARAPQAGRSRTPSCGAGWSSRPPTARSSASRPAIQRVMETIASVADTDANVLIIGESGTGKELIANALHERSARARRALDQDQLRGAAQGPHRVRAVRPHQGLVHGRHHREGRPARGGPQGLAAARRDHRDADRPAGQAAARAGGARGAAAGRRQVDPRRLPAHLLDQPQPRAGGEGRPAPAGPLLPHQHRDHRGAAAARAARGHSRSSCARSSSATAPSTARRSRASSPRPTGACWPTRGPATCASCSTRIERAVLVARGREITLGDLPESLQHGARRGAGGGGIAPSEVPSGSLEEIERASILKALDVHALEQAGRRRAARPAPPDALLEDAQAQHPAAPALTSGPGAHDHRGSPATPSSRAAAAYSVGSARPRLRAKSAPQPSLIYLGIDPAVGS